MTSTRRTNTARALAALLALTIVRPLWAAPGDITAVPAPALGADPPKARDISDGDASVSTQTGAFSYSYPIAVPPGRLGMQPSLALSYSSQGANYGGIAAGWSLSLPEIKIDTSESLLPQLYFRGLDSEAWRRERVVSTLAGGRPLVEVEEPAAPDVEQTYRARNDSSYARYERMKAGSPYRWRVRLPDGMTHFFGGSAQASSSSYYWSPLTRSEDAYGNVVEYRWSAWEISQILYTSNVSGLPPFARVDFEWETGFTCNGSPVGSQEDRRLEMVHGERQLARIRSTAFEPTTALNPTPLHTRLVTLQYSPDLAACSSKRAPARVLTQIQESAWGVNAPRVDLPPVVFEYGRFERAFDQRVEQQAVALWGDDAKRANLGWGTRPNGAGWPAVESMFLDFDGDGLQDRVYVAPDAMECKFGWSKNLGRQANGSLAFLPQPTQTLPRMPWQFGDHRDPEEWCSLSSQFTKLANRHPDEGAVCDTNTGSYLVYRWMDMTGDQLPDLVTALHYDPNWVRILRDGVKRRDSRRLIAAALSGSIASG